MLEKKPVNVPLTGNVCRTKRDYTQYTNYKLAVRYKKKARKRSDLRQYLQEKGHSHAAEEPQLKKRQKTLPLHY
jgi:hypothetical protein